MTFTPHPQQVHRPDEAPPLLTGDTDRLELLEGTGLEASHLSQHLATLRRHRVVTSSRTANTVTYSLAHPKVAELLAIARTFLLDTLADSREQLAAAQRLPALGSAA